MSISERSTIEETHASGTRAGWTTRRVVLAAVLALLLVSLGYVGGARSPWMAHHPSVVSGTAERVPANVPYAYFQPDDGDKFAFRLDDVAWESGDRVGSGNIPPCLREAGESVAVHAGVIEVARPYGSGSYRQVLSVTCLD
ncbi:hypothetical protein BKA08_003787 [Nocardioides marinisabuli]|uniref:Uncharacterized protein n=1 Tax=Nocardioides marinisabuli TaxID=419476 RepID=A0A7Y9F4K8_9ACTN|nr:hypothetical protein [Nocardioides marinisabuli]NYD59549.1 hypothetical protein [Nocardioides marinisabuli]